MRLYSPSQARSSALISVLQACLNGARAPGEHPALPLTPAQLAADARACVAAGARSLHMHPRDASGAESLDADDIAAALWAVRAAVPGVEDLAVDRAVDRGRRRQAPAGTDRGWTEQPDLVSLNLSEPGWEELAALLAERGIGVEARLGDDHRRGSARRRPPAPVPRAGRDRRRRPRPRTRRGGGRGDRRRARRRGQRPPVPAPRLRPGHVGVLAAAVPLGRDIRIGLEDVLELPGGEIAPGNAALVAAA